MFELKILANPRNVEAVGDLLLESLGALAVSVEDADADSADEEALFGEPGLPAPAPGWNRSVLSALFAEATAATDAATWLLARSDEDDPDAAVHLQAIVEVGDQDWVRITQQQFEPVPVAPGFWIVPSWHTPPAQATQVIRLDPGLAFGTGTHPTTRMCLRWLAGDGPGAAAWKRGRALDYGCGSGILAIAAAQLGASSVVAVDIDPAAVQATEANAAANQVTLQAGLPDLVQGRFDLVVANILATPLQLLAPLLCSHVEPGGWLVLAGILDRQTGDLQGAYAPWLKLVAADHLDGWVLLVGRRDT